MAKADAGPLLREVRTLIGGGDRDGLPDGQLLDRFVDHRDEAAFDLLVRRYGRLVFGVCRRVLADPHSAEDAFQATFLVLVHKAPSLDRRRPVADWLYTVAFRLSLRARAHAARRRGKEAEAARNRSDSFESVQADDTLAILHEELNQLPAQHRVPLVLSYLEGRSYEQVARAVGCPVGSVGFRLTRAKEVLRDRLTHRGVAVPAAGVAALITSATAGASVPVPLTDATVRVALWFTGGQTAGAASAEAVQLAKGAIHTMTTNKLVVAAGMLLAIGLCGGTAWVARSAATDDAPPAAAKRAEKDLAPPALPAGANARMGTAQLRHGETVFFIAYTPDGKHLVTAGRDNAIRLWDRATGREVRQFERASPAKPALDPNAAPKDAMPGMKFVRAGRTEDFPVALSPDGSRLAAGKENVVTVWDVATGKPVRTLTAGAPAYDLHFTPDNAALVAADTNQTVTLWDAAAGTVRKEYKVKPNEDGALMTGAAVSPAGTHLVRQFVDPTAGNGTLQITELATGETRPEIKLSAGGAKSVTFSPDGRLLAWTSFLDGVVVWDLAAHKELGRFGREGMHARQAGESVGFSPDGKTVAVTLQDDGIELWDVAGGKRLQAIGGAEAPRGVRAVRIVIGSGNRMIRTDLAFAPDGKTVAASLGNATVRQFDTESGKETAAAPGHQSGVLAVGSDGRTVATVSRESVRVWDASGREVRHWPLSPVAVAAAVSSDAKRVATSAGNGTVTLWDPATGAKVREIDTRRPAVTGLGFSPDGTVLATKAELNAAVNLWDAATGKHLRTIGQDGEPVFNGGRVTIEGGGVQSPAVVFSPDGRLVAAAGDKKQLAVWDAATGQVACEVPTTGRVPLAAFAFSANGRVLATLTGGGIVTGYEVASGEKRYEFKPAAAADPANGPPAFGAVGIEAFTRGNPLGGGVGFTPDGRFVLAGAGGPAVRAWDTLTGQEAGQFKGHQGSVSALRPSADGRSLVSGSVDTTALVWDLGHLPRVELAREAALTATDVEAVWGDLARSDPAVAFAAGRKLLTDRGQLVALFANRLRPVPAVADDQIAKLVADLGGSFDARRKATAELERLGELALPHLRRALDGNPPLDQKQRVEKLLEKAGVQKPQGNQLRELRAVELLELAGTAEAKAVLGELAKGAAGARLTRDAAAAIVRMGK